MTTNKINSFIKEKIGLTGIVIITAFIGFAIWGQIKRNHLSKNSAFAKGVIVDRSEGSKGSWYWNFTFEFNHNEIKSSAPLGDCSSCEAGDTIFIKYQINDPDNNALISKASYNSGLNK